MVKHTQRKRDVFLDSCGEEFGKGKFSWQASLLDRDKTV